MKTAGRGASYTYTWDGKDSGGNLVGKGIYLYQVTARQPAQDDWDGDKSMWSITRTSADITGCDESTGVATVRVEFMVDHPPPRDPPIYISSAKVEVFDPDLQVLASANATSALPVGEMIYFPELSVHFNKGGTYIFLVSAWDQGGVLDFHMNRNHGPKPLLQQNGRIYVKKVLALIDPGHGADSGTPGYEPYGPNRYSWDEREANLWVAEALQSVLNQHSGTDYCQRKVYEVEVNPNRTRSTLKRAAWADGRLSKKHPKHAVFISLHCNAPSTTSRSTQAWYWPGIVDSAQMALALRGQLACLDDQFGVNRSYSTNDATPTPWQLQDMKNRFRMWLLLYLADREERAYTWQTPCNLLEMVMLTQPDDEDWIYSTDVQTALADRIHRAYCNFTFQPIDYD